MTQLKDKILLALCESESYESGAMLAAHFGVSRAAVGKAVQSLREGGVNIQAATNRGYKLAAGCDPLFAAGIERQLPEQLHLFYFDSVDSTNSEAKRQAAAGLVQDAFFVANSQSGGRGRRGRSFFSPPGSGLYMSLLLHPRAGMADVVTMTTRAAVAAARAIEQVCGISTGIKWVNDLYLNGKKVCGILCEAVGDMESAGTECVVVGVGINIHDFEKPAEIAAVAGALEPEKRCRCALAGAFAAQMLSLCDRLGDMSYLSEYRERSIVVGREITFTSDSKQCSAQALAIDDAGGLLVRLVDGSERTLRSGEISVRLSPGK